MASPCRLILKAPALLFGAPLPMAAADDKSHNRPSSSQTRSLSYRRYYRRTDESWKYCRRANLDDARPRGRGQSKQRAEIQIVSQHDKSMCQGIRHDFGIVCRGVPNLRPVCRRPTCILKHAGPARRQAHVDKEVHAVLKGTSDSSDIL